MPGYILLRFVAALAVLAALSSCIRENFGGKDGDAARIGYFSFRFDAGGGTDGGTRAEEEGSDAERSIGQLYLLLYNREGDLKYAWDLEATNTGSSGLVEFEGADVVTDNTPTRGSFTSIARQISYEPYKLVVIANPGIYADPNIFDKNPGTDDLGHVIGTDDPAVQASKYANLASLQTAVTGVTPAGLGAAYDAAAGTGEMFFMSNANGPVPVTYLDIKFSKEDAEADPAPVYIDRALAKVVVNQAQAVSVLKPDRSENIGSVAELKWRVRNYNTTQYLLRRFGLIDPALGGVYGGAAETYESGLAVGREYLYAEDPNMAAGGAGLEDNSAAVWTLTWNAYAASVTESNYFYTTENVMNVAAQASWAANATYVEIWAKLEIDDLQTGTAGTPTPFYSFNDGTSGSPDWKIFSWEQVSDWWTNDAFPAEIVNLKDAITALETAGGFSGPFDFDSATEPGGVSGEAISTASTGDIHYHSEGSCFYRVPIQHFNTASQTEDDYGYYGVVRNNIYRITLAGFTAPGDIPGVADDSKNISFQIMVNLWNVKSEQENSDVPPIHHNE